MKTVNTIMRWGYFDPGVTTTELSRGMIIENDKDND